MLNKRRQSGQTLIIITAVILLILVVVAVNTSSLVATQQKKQPVLQQTKQSFFAAEGALEDALLRIVDPNLSHSTLSSLTINGALASVNITQSGDNLTIAATADKSNHIRKLAAVLAPNTTGVSFNYGVLAGQGGFELGQTSSIVGNVYANGNIEGDGGNVIQGDAWVAGGSGTLSGVSVQEDAHAHTISNSAIQGDAYYQTISGSTVAGASNPGSPDPPSEALPISQTQIDAWKTEAAGGGSIGSYTLDGTNTASLGPKKITGNLSTRNSARLTITGTLWVTGNVTLENSSVLQLHPGYGATSGAVIVDGTISLTQSALVCGSEGYGGSGSCNTSNQSYLLLLSTSNADPAISFNQSGTVNGILYAANGVLEIGQSAVLKEASGYKIRMRNSATIIYESGLINTSFSSGPGGGWDIVSWKEI